MAIEIQGSSQTRHCSLVFLILLIWQCAKLFFAHAPKYQTWNSTGKAIEILYKLCLNYDCVQLLTPYVHLLCIVAFYDHTVSTKWKLFDCYCSWKISEDSWLDPKDDVSDNEYVSHKKKNHTNRPGGGQFFSPNLHNIYSCTHSCSSFIRCTL